MGRYETSSVKQKQQMGCNYKSRVLLASRKWMKLTSAYDIQCCLECSRIETQSDRVSIQNRMVVVKYFGCFLK